MTRSFRTASLAGTMMATAIAVMSPTSAMAVCAAWNLTGTWNFYQDNGIMPTFVITQLGGHLTGRGVYGSVPQIPGQIDGSIDGSRFHFTANWRDGGSGEYIGHIGSNGGLSGTTNGVGWHEYYSRTAGCLGARFALPTRH